ncbi:MAG TPA: SDR family oxidoreductase, partial [Methanoculleus sp.]|nr:SDR family oxidoreductase [Methanoculleus sp.]
SKHGVVGLAMNVAYAYAKKGIRSNVIAPGGVSTDILTGKSLSREGTEVYMAGMATNPRMGEPIEVARVALFLASDEASLVNGAVITADAGWTAY